MVIVYVDIEEMLFKYFVVFGLIGVGKLIGVLLLFNEILKVCLNLCIFLFDVYNEYGCCFGDCVLVLNL